MAELERGGRGFTIVEVLVAIVILSVGITALVMATGAVTRLLGGGHRAELGALLGARALERARQDACVPARRADGSETLTRGGALLARATWTFHDAGGRSVRARVIATVAVGANRALVDTLETAVICLT